LNTAIVMFAWSPFFSVSSGEEEQPASATSPVAATMASVVRSGVFMSSSVVLIVVP
jgi:hypothetical protein